MLHQQCDRAVRGALGLKHFKTFEMIEAVVRAGSIRKAAEDMNITASALNRRIQSFESEFGYEIFERLPRGMRLNPAGELLVQHIRTQIRDLARVKSHVSDLSGLRRGHVSIASSQALIPYFLPQQIALYRAQHPNVTFSVEVRDRAQAERDLSTFNSDMALVFEPMHMVEFDVIQAIPQAVHALFNRKHPLAGTNKELRLRDCLEFPCVCPSLKYGVRNLLETGAKKIGRPLNPVIETDSFEMIRHYVLHEDAVGFQIPLGIHTDPDQRGILSRRLSIKDVPQGQLLLGQMKGRMLPVASSRFAAQLASALEAIAETPG